MWQLEQQTSINDIWKKQFVHTWYDLHITNGFDFKSYHREMVHYLIFCYAKQIHITFPFQNILFCYLKCSNVGEYRRGNQKWTIYGNWQYRARWRKAKQKHNTIYVGHHYTQANTNNVNKPWAKLSKQKFSLLYFPLVIITIRRTARKSVSMV